ncbi:hypothetical protein CLA01_42710 [Chryseobacterium lathyri]|jgi:hypothetical protein|uniref:Uncharacterized protein n=1 Tax=Chryseobacterium lathyri TaxID=395933 RepID=A0A511YG92_9FLAO|nr:hypothetical protein CLA01_42710 [Chryseobacterium lathyri]
MNTDVCFLIGGIILFFILINVLLYFYHKLRFNTSFKEIRNDILEIKGDTGLGNFKITLNFKHKNFDLHSVV